MCQDKLPAYPAPRGSNKRSPPAAKTAVGEGEIERVARRSFSFVEKYFAGRPLNSFLVPC